MLEFNQTHLKELCDLIKYDNAVLFLRQDYQNAICGNSFFVNEINTQICTKEVSNPSYPTLWSKMSELSSSRKSEGGHAILDDCHNVELSQVRSWMKAVFEDDFADLSDKTKEEFRPKYELICKIVLGE